MPHLFSDSKLAYAGGLIAFCLLLCSCEMDSKLQIDVTTETVADTSWSMHGLDAAEQRHSQLDQINAQNIGELELTWSYDLADVRGIEATPLVIDGVMYTTGTWSVVYALDARTGAPIWTYDPRVPKSKGQHACCDVVNRGVAVHGDHVFIGTLDGRLIALDKSNGEPVWSTATFDPQQPYTITGAPRVVNDLVLIGNGGAEYGVRGYVSAYRVDSGELAWRFYTVPGNPATGFENEAMKQAAYTWNGEWWKYGGGGTVWDSMAYDAQLNQLYIGVGNGSPWNAAIRSPGGGDNLFLSSIVALDPATGNYLWHYQTTPGDAWDYTATQHMILADLKIDGSQRQVIMQAPKNGFFYVIDRTNGELISAEPYVPVNWASHIDAQTGRPVLAANARYQQAPHVQKPSPFGGHNWHPMAFNPQTGLVYIPALDVPFAYADNKENFEYREGTWNLGTDALIGALPDDRAMRLGLKQLARGALIAWDPIKQQEAWRFQHRGAWNGGALSTAGNLVFQGSANGELVAYNATNGEVLWSRATQTGVVAPPITYALDGEQYVAVMAGWGGAFALVGGNFIQAESATKINRVLVYKLNGTHSLPEQKLKVETFPMPPEPSADSAQIQQGHLTYQSTCQFCHGDSAVGGGLITDLRRAPSLQSKDAWRAVVHEGAMASLGMQSFAKLLTANEVENVRQYVMREARIDWALLQDQELAKQPTPSGEH